MVGDKTAEKGAGVWDGRGNVVAEGGRRAIAEEAEGGDAEAMRMAWGDFNRSLHAPEAKAKAKPAAEYAALPDYVQRPLEALIAGGTLPPETRRAFSAHVVGLVRRLTPQQATSFVSDLADYHMHISTGRVTNLQAFAVERLRPYLPMEATCLFSHTLLDPAYQTSSTDFAATTRAALPAPLMESRAHTAADPSNLLPSSQPPSDDVLALANATAARGATAAEDARALTALTATGAVPTSRYPLRAAHPTARDLLVARASGLNAANLPPGKLVDVPLNVAARQSGGLDATIWREQEERRAALEESRSAVEAAGTPDERRLFKIQETIEERLAERRALSQRRDREGLRLWQRNHANEVNELRKEKVELQRELGLLPDVPHGTI